MFSTLFPDIFWKFCSPWKEKCIKNWKVYYKPNLAILILILNHFSFFPFEVTFFWGRGMRVLIHHVHSLYLWQIPLCFPCYICLVINFFRILWSTEVRQEPPHLTLMAFTLAHTLIHNFKESNPLWPILLPPLPSNVVPKPTTHVA